MRERSWSRGGVSGAGVFAFVVEGLVSRGGLQLLDRVYGCLECRDREVAVVGYPGSARRGATSVLSGLQASFHAERSFRILEEVPVR